MLPVCCFGTSFPERQSGRGCKLPILRQSTRAFRRTADGLRKLVGSGKAVEHKAPFRFADQAVFGAPFLRSGKRRLSLRYSIFKPDHLSRDFSEQMLLTSKYEKEIRETRRRDEHIALTNRRLPNSLGSGPDCELQAMQIFPSRNRDRPELHQVRSSPLSIEKLKPRLV
jgi:hypothetical protein